MATEFGFLGPASFSVGDCATDP